MLIATSIRMRERAPLAFARGWTVRRGADTLIHVMPEADMIAHVADRTCSCRPKLDELTGRVYTHHSADEREHFEDLRIM